MLLDMGSIRFFTSTNNMSGDSSKRGDEAFRPTDNPATANFMSDEVLESYRFTAEEIQHAKENYKKFQDKENPKPYETVLDCALALHKNIRKREKRAEEIMDNVHDALILLSSTVSEDATAMIEVFRDDGRHPDKIIETKGMFGRGRGNTDNMITVQHARVIAKEVFAKSDAGPEWMLRWKTGRPANDLEYSPFVATGTDAGQMGKDFCYTIRIPFNKRFSKNQENNIIDAQITKDAQIAKDHKVIAPIVVHDAATLDESTVIGVYSAKELVMLTGIPMRMFVKCVNSKEGETWVPRQEETTKKWIWELEQ